MGSGRNGLCRSTVIGGVGIGRGKGRGGSGIVGGQQETGGNGRYQVGEDERKWKG